MTIDLPLSALLFMYGLLLVPLIPIAILTPTLIKDTLIGAARMTIQLMLVGLYLKYIFQLNNTIINILWISIMIAVANHSVLKKAGLSQRLFFGRTLIGITVSTLFAGAWFILIAIRPTPLLDARYLIPIMGMILGNCLRSNVLSLERFYSSIHKNETEFTTYLLLGATLHEAVRPYLKTALKAAINPSIASMATMGIVSLPGMMTGQILAGASPFASIKYQIGIMISIFAAMVIASLMNIMLTLPIAFNKYHCLRHDIFRT